MTRDLPTLPAFLFFSFFAFLFFSPLTLSRPQGSSVLLYVLGERVEVSPDAHGIVPGEGAGTYGSDRAVGIVALHRQAQRTR